MATVKPWKRRTAHRGQVVTRRMAAMLKAAEKITGFAILLSQGSYNAGRVGASAGTHDREAADARIRTLDGKGRIRVLTHDERVSLVIALKRVGFACWYRPEVRGLWGPHVHMVPIGGDLSPAAAAQVKAFDAGRDGLRGNRVDKTYHPRPRVRWSYPLGRPVRRAA